MRAREILQKVFFVYDFVLGYTSEVLEWEAILVEMSRNSVKKSYISVWGFYVRSVSQAKDYLGKIKFNQQKDEGK